MAILYSRRTFFSAAASLTAGCATQTFEGPVDSLRSSGTGLIVVSATHPSSARSSLHSIFYMNAHGPGFAPLVDATQLSTTRHVLGVPIGSDFPSEEGRVHILQVAAGRHSITHWAIQGNGGFITPRIRPPTLWFEVNEADVVYIGNLHMEYIYGTNVFGQRIIIGGVPEIRQRAEIDLAIAEKRAAGLSRKARQSLLPLGEWLSPSRDVNVSPFTPAPVPASPAPR